MHLFDYSSIECHKTGIMFYNVLLNDNIDIFTKGDIIEYAYLDFDKGIIIFGTDKEELEKSYKYEFSIIDEEINGKKN